MNGCQHLCSLAHLCFSLLMETADLPTPAYASFHHPQTAALALAAARLGWGSAEVWGRLADAILAQLKVGCLHECPALGAT